MWQRVQTLYLALATVLTGVMFFCEKAGEYRYTAYIPYLILLIIITALNFLALTSWRFRVFQMRTAVLSALITLAFQIWLAVDYFTADKSLVFHASAVFPLVAVIFDVLAARGIMADELMVRSSDRLRAAKRKQHQ